MWQGRLAQHPLTPLADSLSCSQEINRMHPLQVQFSRGEHYAQQVNALFCETSALDATNVEELFIQISKWIVQVACTCSGCREGEMDNQDRADVPL